MNKQYAYIAQLYSIRNHYGNDAAAKKVRLLNDIRHQQAMHKKAVQLYHDCLLFLIAYPDSKTIYSIAIQSLQQLYLHIQSNEKLKKSLYNSGITHSTICAAFSFEIVKWLRKINPTEIKLYSFNASDSQIQSILSVVMPKVESEILQDANAEWRGWLKRIMKEEEDLLDMLIAIFDGSTIRPEAKDELWNAIGINVEINFSTHCKIPGHLIKPFYHRSLIGKHQKKHLPVLKPLRIQLNKKEAEQVIECSRKVLIGHLREIDPITFTAAGLIDYYQLPRGISIALMGMVPERRHPIDSYFGYMVYKNGLPIAYAGSWILFNSGRIGLNVFPAYRGGESQYIFQQVLQLHQQVYNLKRFTVDPYQIGKENTDGIHSGAFWVYHHAGFRPILKAQQEIAEAEALKIKTTPGYRSTKNILKILADSRLQLMYNKSAVKFDATDLSIVWSVILEKKYNNNRRRLNDNSIKKLASLLQLKNYQEEKMRFILQNWYMLLVANEKELAENKSLQKILKKLFMLKATGSEEEYIMEMQKSVLLRKFIEDLLEEFGG
ncbi:MAG: hypothetical protein ABIW38_14645 [Ferruginibacter sp.]